MVIRFDRILSFVLKFIGEKLVHQPDSAAFLKLVDQNAASMLRNFIERKVELGSAIAAARTEDVSGQALRMNAYERCFLSNDIAHHQRNGALRFIRRFETEEPKRSVVFRGEAGFRDLRGFHQA